MEKLGHYRIESTLGQGAMGVVYRAVDERLERTVALKVLSLALDGAERVEYAARLQQEAKSAARLNHPNIITVYDCGDIDGHAYLAIEFVDGKTLQSLLASGLKFSSAKVVKLAGQLFGALAYAHEHHVVHRDIKPANLMLTPDGRLKITDFGIAQLPTSDLTRVGTVVGSPRYMAPEQVEGKKLDGRADIFAAGIVLYEILTGKRPFDGEHVATIAYRILHEAPEDIRAQNPDVPEWLAELVMRCLEKDPAKRFQTAREARSALREQTVPNGGDKAAVAETTKAAAEAVQSPAARPYIAWLAAAAIVGVAAVAGMLLLGKSAKVDQTPPPAVEAAVQPEVMEPPGAPGSLPADAAMPVQQASTSLDQAKPMPATDETPASKAAANQPESAEERKSAAGGKNKPPVKTKTTELNLSAEPVRPAPPPERHETKPSKPAAEKHAEPSPSESKDNRSLLEIIAGCKAPGDCPEPKRPAKRDR